MTGLQINHNEKLHYNIGHYCPLVNPISNLGVNKSSNANKNNSKKKSRCADNIISGGLTNFGIDYDYYVENLYEYIENIILAKFAGNDGVVNVNLFGRKQYVKISNAVFELKLKPKVLEFYCILAYITYSDTQAKLSIRSLAKQYELLTHKSIDKDTVHRYLTTLISKGLVVRNSVHRNYLSVGYNIELIIKSDLQNIINTRKNNFYLEPNNKWTPYYIGMAGTGGKSVLELLIGSVTYTTHNIKHLASKLSTSPTTIYKHLKQLISEQVILRTKKLINSTKFQINFTPLYKYRYHNTLREAYTEFNERLRLSKNEYKYHLAVLKNRKVSIAPSRKWFVGKIGYYMNKYKIKLNKTLLNFSISDVILQIEKLEDAIGEGLNAKIIVSALTKYYQR